MSIELNVEVNYARELAVALREAFPNALDQGVSDAVALVGERIANDARQFCPVRTGFLQSTIALDPTGEAKWVFVLVARAPYASYVEFGTRKIAPRLFLSRAVALHATEMVQEVENAAIRAALESLG